jgi:hypothetical protein
LPPKAKKAEKPAEVATDSVAAEVPAKEVKAAKPGAKKSSKTETKES